MTEAEWLACTDPERLLVFLKGKTNDRKLRLFACACCRRIWHLLDGCSRNLVDVTERYVDGEVSAARLAFVEDLHKGVARRAQPHTALYITACAVNRISTGAAWPLAWNIVSEVRMAIRIATSGADTFNESIDQTFLGRDIFGNPFRPLPPLPPDVLAWNDRTVPRIAEGIYGERAFDRMPILADALLDAGCIDEDLIAHCRSAGPHVRGCWALDLVLGKE